MSFESAFLELMQDTITRQVYTGTDDYGKPAHSTTATEYTARVVFKEERKPGDTRFNEVVSAVAWVASTGIFDAADLITLPDDSQPNILAVEAFPDEDGRYHHIKISFG